MNCPSATLNDNLPNPPSFGLLLRQVRDGLVRQLDAEMKGVLPDFGFSHYVGLKVLSLHSPCTANELAQALDQTPSAVTRLLDKLEALGYVRREPHAQDRRALQIVMTDEGRQMWIQLKVRGDHAMDYALRDLTPDERDQLISLMTRVRDSLNNHS
ncbi:MAG TPA: MarR family transcriptional regulator [Stenotrophomonas sp.]|jgi:DNA-binding MarR family transcriptional regulator